MSRNLVSQKEVRKWLVDEDENVRSYLKAWKATNPYDSLSRIRLTFWAMVVTVALAFIWAMVGPDNGRIVGYVCLVIFLGLAFFGWMDAKKELKKFSDAVVWCEFEAIPEHVLLRSKWTREDVAEVLDAFAGIIKLNILPLEQEYKDNHLFPKKSAKARKLHNSIKARLAKEIKMIAPMFSHFHGVDNPLEEAFRLADEKR